MPSVRLEGMRTRAPLLFRFCTGLLVGALAVGATVALSRVALDAGRDSGTASTATRSDDADTSGPSVLTRVSDRFDVERGARRVDLAIVAAAFLAAAGWAWWITHRRRTTRVVSTRLRLGRPRAPPHSPALVCT